MNRKEIIGIKVLGYMLNELLYKGKEVFYSNRNLDGNRIKNFLIDLQDILNK